MKSNIGLAGLGLLSVLGLFSCSSDKPDTSWALSEPTVQSSELDAIRVSTASYKQLPGDSALVFRESETKGTTTSVRSVCESATGSATFDLKVREVTHLSLQSLWPTQFLVSLKEEELKKSSCSFEFMMVTDEGSSHRFNLTSVRLKNFASHEQGAIDLDATKLSSDFFAAVTEALPTFNSGKIYLACENFWNQVENANSLSQRDSMVERLFFGPLPSSISDKSDNDPRLNRSEQSCHLVAASEAEAHIGRRVRVSKLFKVQFSPPALEISYQMYGQSADVSQSQRFAFVEFEIENRSSIVTAFKLNSLPSNVRVQKLLAGNLLQAEKFRPGELALAPHIETLALSYEFVTHGRSWQRSGVNLLEIAPHQRIRIRGMVETPCFRIQAAILREPLSTRNEIVEKGYYFDFDRPFVIGQLHNWNPAEVDLNSSTSNQSLSELKARAERPLNFQTWKLLEDTDSFVSSDPQSDFRYAEPTAGVIDLQCLY